MNKSKKCTKNYQLIYKAGYQSPKGITLVSLLVTIIVILILAGMSISLTIGNNGLFSRAKNVAEKYEFAQKNEIKDLENFYNKIDNELNQGKQKRETVEVNLTTSLNHSKNFDGVIIKYSVRVTEKVDQFYTFEIPEETQIYTAESDNNRKIDIIYKEKEMFLYKGGKENTQIIDTFNYKKTNHSPEYTGTGSYSKNSNNITVSVNNYATSLMITNKKVNVEGYSKLLVKANITKNTDEVYEKKVY